MNVAILVGKVASEIKTTPVRDGTVTRFRLRTVEQYSLDGELKERGQTHLIDIWNRYLQTNIIPMLKQGQTIEIQGSIESRNMAREGESPRWTTAIVVRNNGQLIIMGGTGSNSAVHSQARDDDEGGQQEHPNGRQERSNGPRVDHSGRRSAPLGGSDGLDDDVPF